MLILCNWEILEILELGNNQVWKLPKHTQNVWTCDNCKFYLHATKDNFYTWNLIWNIVCSSIFPNWQFLFIKYSLPFCKVHINIFFSFLWCRMGGQHLTRYLALTATSFAKKFKIVKNYPKTIEIHKNFLCD